MNDLLWHIMHPRRYLEHMWFYQLRIALLEAGMDPKKRFRFEQWLLRGKRR